MNATSTRPRVRACALLATIMVSMLLGTTAGIEADETFPGVRSSFRSYDRYDFELDGRQCIVVAPQRTAEGRPWIWRARFFGHEPQTDLALLERGFHVAYIDVAGLYGAPRAVAIWDGFYDYLTERHGFASTPVLEGFSRGGLIVYNWAAKNPDKLACIYADAPVCDFKSWPGGKGIGAGHADSWAECLEAYGLTEDQALTATCNPIDNIEPLARAHVPLLHVVGDADEVVPVAENTAVLEERYKALGGSITVIHKSGVGHHPHSLKDPSPIVGFITEHVDVPALEEPEPIRERIEWCDIWITNADRGTLPRVLMIGDSITRGYFGGVEKALEGRANCARLTTSRCICDPVFFAELKLVLPQYDWAVIHFNNGLHGMGYTELQYRQTFSRLMQAFKQYAPNAQLIWTTTTAVRDRDDPSKLSPTTKRVRERNRIAAEFVSAAGLPVDDLFRLVVDRQDFYSADGVHFNARGKAAQIKQVAESIDSHLPVR